MFTVSGYADHASIPELTPYGKDPVNVKKIVVDQTSGKTTVILPIMPIGRVSKSGFGVDDFTNAYRDCSRAVGLADLTLMKTPDGHFAHPSKRENTASQDYQLQQTYSVGKLQYVFPVPDNKNRVIGAFDVTDPVAAEVFQQYQNSYNIGAVPLFTSCMIINSASENQHAIKHFDLMHVTLTDDPSFGKELTQVGAVCAGPVDSCVVNYKLNAASNVGMSVVGKIIDLRYEQCPFCVRSEMVRLMEQNKKINEDSCNVVNLASNLRMPDKPADEAPQGEAQTNIILPDKKDSEAPATSPLDAMMKEVITKVDELSKKTEANTITTPPSGEKPADEEKPKHDDNPEKKESIKWDDIDITKHPKFNDTVKAIVAEAITTSKEKDSEYQQLRSESRFNKIGQILASHQRNFVDPNTGKGDPKKFDAALDFLVASNWKTEDISKVMETLSPFATVETPVPASEGAAPEIKNKASSNRGVPTTDAALKDKEDVKNKASNHDFTPKSNSMRFVDSVIYGNSA
jgi:hypothetical protein